MLLSMLFAVLLGPSAVETAAAAGAAPARPTIEISLADTLRALPVNAASSNGGFLQDDGSSGDGPPILPHCADCPAATTAEAAFAFPPTRAAPTERRPNAHRARAPPTA